MKLHANARTCPNSRRLMVRRIEEADWSLTEAACCWRCSASPGWPRIVWLGLSILAILLFFWLLRNQKGREATSFLYVVPSLAAIAAVPVLGQSLSAGVVVGLVFGLVEVNLVGSGQRSGRRWSTLRPHSRSSRAATSER